MSNKTNNHTSIDAQKQKELYDIIEAMGEGVFGKLHIIDTHERFPDEKNEYRIYHADGYCFDVCREKVYTAEDETNQYEISGYEYTLNEGAYDGFKEAGIDEAIRLVKSEQQTA